MGTYTSKGASLIEVMVALFVLAIGILGILALQSKSMQYTQASYAYSQAVYLANDMAERLRNNPQSEQSYINTAVPTTAPSTNCKNSQCTEGELVAWDLYVWGQLIKQQINTTAEGTIAEDTTDSDYTRITISFDDSRVVGDASGSETQEYSLLVEL